MEVAILKLSQFPMKLEFKFMKKLIFFKRKKEVCLHLCHLEFQSSDSEKEHINEAF